MRDEEKNILAEASAVLYATDVGFCREDGLPYEVHTPDGWVRHGNDPPQSGLRDGTRLTVADMGDCLK